MTRDEAGRILMEAFPGCPANRDLLESYVSDNIIMSPAQESACTFMGKPVKTDLNLPRGAVGFAFAPRATTTYASDEADAWRQEVTRLREIVEQQRVRLLEISKLQDLVKARETTIEVMDRRLKKMDATKETAFAALADALEMWRRA